MARRIFVILIILSFAWLGTSAQASTNVTRIEIDGQQLADDYSLVFDAGNFWIQARRTPAGFMVPKLLANKEYLTFVFRIGKYKLEFSNLHRSKFTQDWIVGVDEKPYSPEYVDPKQHRKTLSAYYIVFGGGTQVIVTTRKAKKLR